MDKLCNCTYYTPKLLHDIFVQFLISPSFYVFCQHISFEIPLIFLKFCHIMLNVLVYNNSNIATQLLVNYITSGVY